jgi:predicted nucleic acid-binding protein
MKGVINTGPLIKLAQIKRLNLLIELYDELVAPLKVKEELKYPIEAVNFLNEKVNLRSVDKNLAKKWSKKLKIEEADVEVFLVYKDTNADEMIFANKKAEKRIGKYGYVRDIIYIKNLAEEKGIFTRQDSKSYLEDLKRIKYRPKDVEKELKKYS